MTRAQLLGWLKEEREAELAQLWAEADTVRRNAVGDAVHLRGLVEVSNHCVRRCGYCGISLHNRELVRYRMEPQEVVECARQAAALGYGTVVLQAGEDYGITRDWLAAIVREIKDRVGLAVTLSLGERPEDDLVAWLEAGADRYLLRFETSDSELYERIHPSLPGRSSDRFALLGRLRELGYEIGSGVMIGVPGQRWESLATDIETFAGLDLDMIGVGPYLPHPSTPLGRGELPPAPDGEQVPNTELMTYKVVALTRMFCSTANIPSTTALATLNTATGRELGLSRGANVVMPNLTPTRYRQLYEIYPGKACLSETAVACGACLRTRIERLGRTIGAGPGGRSRSPEHP
jgi:biotin synthase